ncbi:MAG: efflux RND transporter permease subunit [Maricaulaceae bacterium]
MTLSDIAVTRPVLAAVASALLVVFGVIAFQTLPLRELPDVDRPIVSVTTVYPGASAEVVENRITTLVEDQLSGIEGVRQISSSSRDGRSNITIEFSLNRDLEAAANDVRDAVSRVADALPLEADPPEVEKQDADAQPIMWLSLVSNERSTIELSDFSRRYVTDRLSIVDGVSAIRQGGGLEYAMRVWLDRRGLAARGLTVDDVEQALRAQNVELPAGELEGVQSDLTVRIERGYLTPRDFAALPVAEGEDGHVVRLGEVAEVELAPEERRTLFRGNGANRVGLGIVRQSKSNALEVAGGVRAELARLNATFPPDIRLDVSFDGTRFIDQAIKEVWKSLGLAVAMVVAVIYLFLGSPRAAAVPAVVVPICLVATFIVLAVLGFTLNILTLLALVLAIGLVVDDSIVVLENIQRRVDSGEPPLVAAYRGARQVFFAVIATTAVVIAVFAPLMVTGGYVGRIFVELAATICGAVVVSSFVALTLSPMMCSKMLQPATDRGPVARAVDWAVNGLRNAYEGALLLLLPRSGKRTFLTRLVGATPLLVFLAAAFGFIGVVWSKIDWQLIPEEDRGSMFAFVAAPPGASFDHTSIHAMELEDIFLSYVENGEAGTAIVRVPGFGGVGFNSAIGILLLEPWDERERTGQEILREMNGRLSQLTGVFARAGMRSPLGSSDTNQLQFVLGGQSYDELNAFADLFVELGGENPGFARIRKEFEVTAPRLVVDIDKDRAAALGVSVQSIGRSLETQLGSRRVGTFVDGGEEYSVILQNRLEDREDVRDLANVFVRSDRSGELVPLTNLVSLNEVGESPDRPRINRLRAITLDVTLADGYALGDAVDWLQSVARERLPDGVRADFTGGARDFQESQNALGFAFVLALVIVFLVLAAQFESLILPGVIMLTVPLAAAGGLFGLYMIGSTLNIYSVIGLIILIGLAAKNGILIVEFANQLRDEGRSVREATLEAAVTRFRPILMTGLSTAIGALPLILGSGAGAESRATIGVVIFSGVMVATLFTLLVIPVFYDLVARYTRSPQWIAKALERYESGETQTTDGKASRPQPAE